MVGFAAAAGAGDLGFPVRGFVVKSAKCFSTLGDGRPGFVCARDIGHEATSGEGDVTVLRGLSLRHAKTARLFCSGRRFGERLCLNRCGKAPQADENEEHEGPALHHAHPSIGVNRVSRTCTRQAPNGSI